jgi:hypothetical protein
MRSLSEPVRLVASWAGPGRSGDESRDYRAWIILPAMRVSLGLGADVFVGAIHHHSSGYAYSPDGVRANPDCAWPTAAVRVNKRGHRSVVHEK